MRNKREIGAKGEEMAIDYLKNRDQNILDRNYYGKYGEIDIIVKDKDSKTIIFVEVKFRSTSKYGLSQEAITNKKKKRLYLTALEYLNKYNFKNKNFRFDLIAINGSNINWIKNIIWGDEIGF